MAKIRSDGAFQHRAFGLVLQALVLLGQKDETCSSCELAGRLASDATLLRRIMANLTREGILVTREGRDGGYLLNRKPEELTLAEVYLALEVGESCSRAVSGTMPAGDFGERMKAACGEVLEEMDRSVLGILENYTLADLMRRAGC